jgi:hypothetical protein
MASWRASRGLGAQKLTKSLRNSFYAALVCGNVLVTVLEARLTPLARRDRRHPHPPPIAAADIPVKPARRQAVSGSALKAVGPVLVRAGTQVDHHRAYQRRAHGRPL